MKHTKLIILFLIIQFSCQKNETDLNAGQNYTYTLKKIDEIKLPLDNETSYEMYFLDYLKEDGEEFLYTWNHFINGVNIFSLTKKEQVRKIKIPREGPNSLRSLQGFTLVSKDSIFLYGRGATHITKMVNSDGVLLNAGFVNRDVTASIFNHVSNNNSPTFKHNNYLCFSRLPIMDLSDPNNINDKFEFEIWYDLEKGAYKNMGITFPKSYHNKVWGTHNYVLSRRKGHNGYFVYSWPVKDEVFITNFKGDSRWVDASLDAAKGNISKSLNYGHTNEEALQEIIDNYTYRTIYYDKFRQVYYRTVLNPINDLPSDDYTVMLHQPVSVVILDKDFNKIGEVDLDRKKYSFTGWFVGEKGLYIPQINPNNSDLKEDEIIFSIYNLERINDEN